MELGYCCINLSLHDQEISTNRGMIKKTFESKGLEYVSELAIKNITDLLTILKWNVANGIRVYRMSSDLFPWMSHYQFEDLPNFDTIKQLLESVGKYAMDNGLRIGFHPGQFNVLPSPNPRVVENTIVDLDQHARILDLMRLPQNHYYSLNIHIGGSYGDKDATLKRFRENFARLSESTRKRLLVENDDKATQYGVQDLYDGVYQHLNVPITFDFFHHLFCTNDLSIDDAAQLAASTWPTDIKPLAHYTSSRKINEDSDSNPRSHADYIYEQIPEVGLLFDIELETKAKDLALLKYRETFVNQFERNLV